MATRASALPQPLRAKDLITTAIFTALLFFVVFGRLFLKKHFVKAGIA